MAKGLPRSLANATPGTEKFVRVVTYPVTNLSLTAATITTGAGSGTAVLGDFPEGNILLLGATSYLQFSTTDTDVATTWDGSYAIGSTPDANVDNASPTTDADVIGQTTINAATARVSPVTRGAKSSPAILNNTDGSLELNLNLIVDTADFADGTTAIFTVNGTVQLCYAVMGDS